MIRAVSEDRKECLGILRIRNQEIQNILIEWSSMGLLPRQIDRETDRIQTALLTNIQAYGNTDRQTQRQDKQPNAQIDRRS